MQSRKALIATMAMGLLGISRMTFAAAETYSIDPDHTYPSFEADHMGISQWRGKMNKSTGKVMLDKATGSGTVDIAIDMASVDFGHDKLNAWAVGPEFFDTAKFPTATFKGKLAGQVKNSPTRIDGQLTFHGVTKPVSLKLNAFKCIQHPVLKRDYCGADALVTIKRDEFGVDAGKSYGFNMDVVLRIQAEAIKDQ